MTILTDISGPENVKVVVVRCDSCRMTQEFSICEPRDLVLTMIRADWDVPSEGKPDLCPRCYMRMPTLGA